MNRQRKPQQTPSKQQNRDMQNGKKGKKKIKVWSGKKKSESEEVVIARLQSQYLKVGAVLVSY